MLKIKKKTVTTTSQITLTAISSSGLKPKIGSTVFGAITPLVRLTTSVSGRIAIATTCILGGKVGEVSGKKVPARKSIGVMKRNDG